MSYLVRLVEVSSGEVVKEWTFSDHTRASQLASEVRRRVECLDGVQRVTVTAQVPR